VKCFNNWGKHKAFIDRRQDCSRGEYIEKWRKMNRHTTKEVWSNNEKEVI
jgi:hypothetical protein